MCVVSFCLGDLYGNSSHVTFHPEALMIMVLIVDAGDVHAQEDDGSENPLAPWTAAPGHHMGMVGNFFKMPRLFVL